MYVIAWNQQECLRFSCKKYIQITCYKYICLTQEPFPFLLGKFKHMKGDQNQTGQCLFALGWFA